MTEQRAPQESALSLKDQLAVQLSVLFGEYTMTQCQNAAESLIPIVESQLAGAVPQAIEALNKITVAAESWHNFHHGSDCIQCDEICFALPACRKAIAQIEAAGLPLVERKATERTHQPGAVPQEELRRALRTAAVTAHSYRAVDTQIKFPCKAHIFDCCTFSECVACRAALESLIEKRSRK